MQQVPSENVRAEIFAKTSAQVFCNRTFSISQRLQLLKIARKGVASISVTVVMFIRFFIARDDAYMAQVNATKILFGYCMQYHMERFPLNTVWAK